MASGLSLNIDTTKSEFQNPMIELRQGDGNYQSLRVTVTSNGEPLMLDGWTISFMGTTAGGHKIVDSATHIINASNGVFDYTPTKAWGQDIGEFDKAYFKFTNGDKAASGANFRVKVFEAVDLTDEEAGDYISVVDVMIDKIKTDMDSKLADTQTTLTNTQSQAKTVQNNINELNTNVNDLKTQNLNIKTTDNTWTGNNKFTNLIDGALETRVLLFTDFAVIAANANNYSGYISAFGVKLDNAPYNNSTVLYGIVNVVAKDGNAKSGYIEFNIYSKNEFWIINFDNGTLKQWVKLSDDSEVVHNTGTETVAGDKTFTGSTTFTQTLTTNGVKPKPATFTDMKQVAADMQTYNGLWYVKDNQTIASDPITGTYHIVDVQMADYKGAGIIKIYNYLGSYDGIYYATVNYTGLGVFVKVAKDDSVVHLSGSEVISGDKAITGSLTISDNNPVRVKQSATVEFPMWWGSTMKATRFGNMVTLHYATRPTQNIPAGTVSTQAIPLGFRPADWWYMAAGGGNSGAVEIGPDGKLNVRGNIEVQYPYAMTAIYFTTDPFPS